jgi:MSHA biogenesis protein MshO
VAVFIKSPVDSYFDAARRAELTDMADTAVRRMARDIHLALPNSVRNPANGSDQCIEFIPTKIGGRYRAAASGSTSVDKDAVLEFNEYKWDGTTQYDNGFDMLWLNSALPAADRIAAGDVVVVYNDGSASGNAYTGVNAIQVAGLVEPGGTANTTAITFVGAGAGTPFNRKQLPSESPANRFQVIPANEHVVAYGCSAGTLRRYSRRLTNAWAQPADCAAMIADAAIAILANNITTCSLHYEPPGSGTGLSRFGIVPISLEINQSGESVRLYHQVHVDNTP